MAARSPLGRIAIAVHGSKNEAKPTRKLRTESGQEISHEDLVTSLVERARVETAGLRDTIACAWCELPLTKRHRGPSKYHAKCASLAQLERSRKWKAKHPKPKRVYRRKPLDEKRKTAAVAARRWRKKNPDRAKEIRRKAYLKHLETRRSEARSAQAKRRAAETPAQRAKRLEYLKAYRAKQKTAAKKSR